MKVINKGLLAEFARPGRCEYCGTPCPEGRDPAHIFSRGAGRVDIRENLASLCRECHSRSHGGGSPSRDDLLGIAVKREKTTPEDIEDAVYALRACDLCKTWRVDKGESTCNSP